MKACFSPADSTTARTAADRTIRLLLASVFLMLFIPMSAQWNNIAPNNSGQSIKFVSSSVGYLQSIYTMQKTTNGGSSWTTIDSVPNYYCEGMYWLNANEGFSIYSPQVGSGGWFRKTSNGGASWTAIQQISASEEFYGVWFTSSTDGYVVGSNGAIYKTINGGSTWTSLSSTTTLALYTVQFVNATTGYAAGDDGIILKTTNSGTTWVQQYQSIYYEFLDIEFTDALHGVATGTYGMLRTTNGGTNWNPVTIWGTTQFIAVDFPSADTGYMTGPGGNVWRTIDSGATWLALNRVSQYFVRDVDFISNDTGYVTTDFTGTWKTTNAGVACPGVLVQNTTSMPDTLRSCAGGSAVFSVFPSALNNYPITFSPSAAVDTSMTSGQYYYTTDTVAGDTQNIVVMMSDPYTGCGTVTDYVVLITDSITYQQPAQPTWVFNLCPGDSIVLDLGANAQDGYYWMQTGDSTQTLTVDTIGLWNGFAYACGGQYGVIFFVQWDTNCSQVCAVDAGPDTTFCQQHGQLFATPASPGSYTFSWSPSTGLDNPNVQNPNVISGVNSQQYIVTMTDTSTSCVAYDTVIVSAYYWVIDTVYTCNNQPVTIDLGPGGTNYTVQYTDTSGNGHFDFLPNEYYVITQPAQYTFIAQYPNCGPLTSMITAIDSCNTYVGNVWPGDCNYDLTANMADALHIGLAYNASGPVRPNATNGWYAQPMSDWSQSYVNCNYKHGDADGNGMIDVNDTLPISQNYSLTHPYRIGAPQVPATAPSLQMYCSVDTVGLQTLVQVDVVLGTIPTPIDSLYGLSFRITTDAGLIDTTLTAINANTSWLGTMSSTMFTFQKNFASQGVTDFCEVKKNHVNTYNGQGPVATFYIVTTDNLSGIATCHFNLSEITAVTVSQAYIALNAVNDSVVIDPGHPAGIQETDSPVTFTMYPNPASEQVTVQTSNNAEVIEICDMTGRVVQTAVPTNGATVINTSALAEGVYMVRVKSGSVVTTEKLTITR